MLQNTNVSAHNEQTPQEIISQYIKNRWSFMVTQPLKYKPENWAMNLKNPEDGNFELLPVGIVISFDGKDIRFAHWDEDQKFYHKPPFLSATFEDTDGKKQQILIFDYDPKTLHTYLSPVDSKEDTASQVAKIVGEAI